MSETDSPAPRLSRAVTPESDDEIDLMSLVGTIWRGKWWIALATALALLIGGYYAFVAAVPVYTASATVALESRQDQVVDIESVVTGLAGDQATINTEVEVLRSRQLMKKLVDALDLVNDPEFNATLRKKKKYSVSALKTYVKSLILPAEEEKPKDPEAIYEATVNTVMRAITVSNKRQSYVFTITAVTTSAEKSARIANKLAELYILDQLEVKFEATEQATEWLTERVGELKVELENAVEKVKAFTTESDVVSPEALEGLNRQLKDQRDRVSEAEAQLERARAQLAALEAAKQSDDPAQMAQAAGDRTLTRLLTFLGNDNAARATFDARFDQIKARAALDVERVQNQVALLKESVSELEQRIESQSADLVKLEQLQREAEASRLIYEYFLGRLKETSVQQGIQQADSRILSRAVVPTEPSAPRKSLILALSAILGAFVGTGGVLLREMLQNTFRTAEDLEAATGYTVMGTIPSIPRKDRKKILNYILEKPSSQAAEAIRNLRTSIMLSNVDNPPKIVMSTSSLPSEGKTTQSILLALNMAALGKKVLLIEGDIRRRVFSKYLDIKAEKGLVSVLAGEATLEEAVQHDKNLGVDVLIGERPRINAADLYASEKFETFLAEMRKTYDLVVIDTPPVLVVPDARVIGPFADAIIYSVKWDDTTKAQVSAGLNMFENVGLKVTGLVLAQVDSRKLKRYGYGNYGGYGYAYSGYYEN